jgi:CubicO group peptidase (beta-lactamase class C family)
MKEKLKIGSFYLLLALGAAVMYNMERIKIANAYVAKMTCTCVFEGGRDPDEVKDHNFYYSILGLVNTDVDMNNRTVTASLWGLGTKLAEHRYGLGCVLLHGKDDKSVSFPEKTIVQENRAWDWPRMTALNIGKIDMQKLNSAFDAVFDAKGTQKIRTASAMVVYRDSIVAERYQSPFKVNMPQLGWSMTKSWVNAVIGTAVRDSILGIDECNLITEWGDYRSNISIRHLLQMNSGMKWEEDYSQVSDATTMLFNSDDSSVKPRQKIPLQPPGVEWCYSSGTTNLLCYIMRETLANDNRYHTYFRNQLFRPLHMNTALVEVDECGHFLGSSYGYASMRDWAKFGQLYLHDGQYGDEQILPHGWVDFTRQEAAGSGGQYGAHFWLNKSGVFPDVPRDMYYASGYLGQYVFIIPSRDVVIVRLGGGDQYFDANTFIKQILDALPNE